LPQEYDRISRLERVCTDCAKAFEPDDELFSALYLEDNLFVRRDRCPECWATHKGGGEFSFWRTVVPEPEDPAKKKRRIDAMLDPQVLFDVFREMTDDPDPRKRRFRFVLSLMLVRRKKLRFVSIAKRKMADGQQDCLVLKQRGRGARLTFDVVDVKLSEEEAVAAQQEVGQLLVMGGVGEASEIDSALAAQEEAAGGPDASGGEEARGAGNASAAAAPLDDGVPDGSDAADELGGTGQVDDAAGPVEADGPDDADGQPEAPAPPVDGAPADLAEEDREG
jgi:hypothetical protein